MAELGSSLRAVRIAQKLSLRDVERRAKGLGVALSSGGLQRIEKGGRYPNVRTLELLARIYDIKMIVDAQGTRVETPRSGTRQSGGGRH